MKRFHLASLSPLQLTGISLACVGASARHRRSSFPQALSQSQWGPLIFSYFFSLPNSTLTHSFLSILYFPSNFNTISIFNIKFLSFSLPILAFTISQIVCSPLKPLPSSTITNSLLLPNPATQLPSRHQPYARRQSSPRRTRKSPIFHALKKRETDDFGNEIEFSCFSYETCISLEGKLICLQFFIDDLCVSLPESFSRVMIDESNNIGLFEAESGTTEN